MHGGILDKALKTFTKKLRQRLNELSWDQNDLAKALHKAHSEVSVYINGKRVPRIDKLTEFADALGVTPSWLIDDSAEEPRVIEKPPTEEELAALVLSKMLSASDRKRLAIFILECNPTSLTTLSDIITPFIEAKKRESSAL